jgi:hypothetical protein
MNQGIIDEQIKFWTEEFPSLARYYSDKNVNGVINLLRTIEDKIPSEALMDFIDGIALYPVYLKSQDAETLKKISEQIAPAFKHLKEHLSSKNYKNFLIGQEITGDETLNLDGVKIPLSKKAIELHIKRLKATPLLPKDVAKIQADLVSYKQNQYTPSGKSQNKDLDTILASQNHLIPKVPMKEVYDHFKPLTETTNKRNKFYLTNQQLLTFMKNTFIDQKPIKQSLNCAPIFNKKDIRKIFYDFYIKSREREKNQKNLKRKYFDILFNSFEGFDSKTDYNDFHKS